MPLNESGLGFVILKCKLIRFSLILASTCSLKVRNTVTATSETLLLQLDLSRGSCHKYS